MFYLNDGEQLLKELFGEKGWVRGKAVARGDRKVFMEVVARRFDLNGVSPGAIWGRMKKRGIVVSAYKHTKEKPPPDRPTARPPARDTANRGRRRRTVSDPRPTEQSRAAASSRRRIVARTYRGTSKRPARSVAADSRIRNKPERKLTMPDPIANIEAMQGVYLGESVRAVMRERVEQITQHGYDAEHDDEHEKKQIAGAAAAFLVSYIEDDVATGFGNFWPWCPTEGVIGAPDKAQDKTDYELLSVAGALILAEMDRIDRIAMKTRHDTED